MVTTTCVFDPPTPADSKKKSLGELFGKVVRKATPPVSTIEVGINEEDSETSDGVIHPNSFCQIPAYWV
jgi:hypothetical protein